MLRKKCSLLLFIGTIFFFCIQISAYGQDDIFIEADKILYLNADRALYASGNVEAKYKGISATANSLLVRYPDKLLRLSDGFEINYKNSQVRGDSLQFDFLNNIGIAKNANILIGRYHIKGNNIHVTEKKVTIKEGSFTTCSDPVPHYHFSANRIEMYPEVGIIILKDTFFHLMDTPVLYLPTYIVGRAEYGILTSQTPLPEIGANDEDGFFIKERFGYFISPKNTGTFNLGYLSSKGLSIGISHQYMPNLQTSHYYGFNYFTKADPFEKYSLYYFFENKIVSNIEKQETNEKTPEILGELGKDTSEQQYITSFTYAIEAAYRRYINFEYVSFYPRFSLVANDSDFARLFSYRWNTTLANLTENEGRPEKKFDFSTTFYKSFSYGVWGSLTPQIIGSRAVSKKFHWEQVLGSVVYSNSYNNMFFFDLGYYHRFLQQGKRAFLYDSTDIFDVDYVDLKFTTKLQHYDFTLRYKYDLENLKFLDLEEEASIKIDCIGLGLRYRVLKKDLKFFISLL